ELGLPALKQALAGSNVQLCIFGGGGGLLAADEGARQAAVEQIKTGLQQAAELGAIGSIVVPVRVPEIAPPEPPKTLYELQCEILIQELAEIAPVAEETGALVLLEPLNRYESRFLNRLDQAAEICRAVGSPGIKFMADFFHMNIEEIDLGRAIEDTADYLGYVHLADSNRFQPGAGHLDFKPGLAALKRIGYDGFMTLECRVMGADKGQALAESARYIRDLWEQV
ncbi:MAG: sugar phosphate isomerase/epimerase, partial [Anaerolineae bacterium]|nr:sugar phosphate isomerase/epimerase [Anaerolineae bacterium]